jgi:16S rRNA (guanine527-N7)-methyltransferase
MKREKPAEKIWADFKDRENLTESQLIQFQKYEALLSEWNKSMNLTAISGLSETVNRHFSDSLIFRKFFDVNEIKLVADVGSGAGFPGVPLKIMFPHLGVILIEVSKKKQKFLNALISTLGLKDIEVCDIDWRTFLRKTESDVEYFLTRASIDPVELVRMFRPGCFYKNVKLVYWAAENWLPNKLVEKFVSKEFAYSIKRKKRKLVLMEKA